MTQDLVTYDNYCYFQIFQFVYSAYATMLGHLRSNALESFKVRLEQYLNQGKGFANAVRDSQQSCLLVFDKGCEGEKQIDYNNFLIDYTSYKLCSPSDAAVKQATWNASKVREKLCRDIDSHAASARTAKLSELTANYEVMLWISLLLIS